jgi:hypothetical protein
MQQRNRQKGVSNYCNAVHDSSTSGVHSSALYDTETVSEPH